MAVQLVDLSTGRFSNHKSFLPLGATLSLLRLEQYCIGLYIIVRTHWWTIIHFQPRCSTAIRYSLVPWLDQSSSKWDCGSGSGLTKYQMCRGQCRNCLVWLLKIVFHAAGHVDGSLHLICFIVSIFYLCVCATQIFFFFLQELRNKFLDISVWRLCVLPVGAGALKVVCHNHKTNTSG